MQQRSINSEVDIDLNRMRRLSDVLTERLQLDLSQQPFRALQVLEVYLYKLISNIFEAEDEEIKADLEQWFQLFGATQAQIPLNKHKKNLHLIGFCRYLQVCSQRLNTPNSVVFHALCEQFALAQAPLFGQDFKLFLLYNMLRILEAESDHGSEFQSFQQSFARVAEFYRLDEALMRSCLAFADLRLFLLFLIQRQILEKKDKYLNQQQRARDAAQEQLLERARADLLYEELYLYACFNFNTTRNKVKLALKKILSFKIMALVELISFKLRGDVNLKFAEMIMSTPFDDDELGVKLSVYLFLKEEYAKLYQIVQNILASLKIDSHPFKPVLISLTAYFIGICLGKNEVT